MTKEERTYITFDEFKELEFECTHKENGKVCGARFSCAIGNVPLLPVCPSCNKEWFKHGVDQRRDALNNILENLKGLAAAPVDFKLRIRLADHD